LKKIGVNRFRCAPGETIHVSVESSNTVHLVAYSLRDLTKNLLQGEALSFVPIKASTDSFVILALELGFSNPNSRYDITIRSDRPGDTFRSIETPNPVTTKTLTFTFLAGDPSTDPD
jgi:hypothetical protein